MTITPSGPPTPPRDSAPPHPARAEHLRVRMILIDIAIVFAATLVGGGIAGFVNASADHPIQPIYATAISNCIVGVLAFTLVGFRAPTGNRWPHLAWVAFGGWLTGLVNVVFFDVTPMTWALGAIPVTVLMGIGGGIAMVFKR